MPDIIAFYNQSVADGSLEGNGQGNSAENKLDVFGEMLAKAEAMIDDGNLNAACNNLRTIYEKCNGDPDPKDFIGGESTSELASNTLNLMESIECK